MTLILHEESPPSGYERLIYVEDTDCGLEAFICIHSTVCGPAAGGCRMWDYANKDDARKDVLRLAKGMTAKNAVAGLGLGGGKSVIIGDARKSKSEPMLRTFGKAVNAFGGIYYTAEDVGMSPDDMRLVAQETPYAVGLEGGEFGSGDPSPFTAEGVFQCLKVGAEEVFGTSDLKDRRVLVQGLGHVGMPLAEKLYASGADLIVSDINEVAVDRTRRDLDAEICPVDKVFDVEMDIFAPCALGGVLTEQTAQRLTARLICGAANNQLETDQVAETLRARGIRYLPDFVVNAGGIISVATEIHRVGQEFREARLKDVAARIREILDLSNKTGISTTQVTKDIVMDILKSAEHTQRKVHA
ncbi:MAG: Glu/Leu/Phe/Val dehydrogenase dimerization domain-containing protein [Pseudomonadota bacterium]